MPNPYDAYREKLQQIADVRYSLAVLQWDQETYMPAKSAGTRARQIATLSEVAHNMQTDSALDSLLEKLQEDKNLSEDERKNIELSLYDINQQKKLPGSFVRQMSEAISQSYQFWLDARKQNKFGIFEESLSKLVDLKKQEANYLGYENHLYNALLNQYERGATVAMIDPVFNNIRQPLKELIDEVGKKSQVDDHFLQQHFDKNQQWKFSMQLLKEMQFDFEAGRQDISEHPFTTNFSSEDVRLTTRIDEKDISNMTWSCIHELGHGLYEQGLPAKEYGLPLGEYASLSIHESQSRLWENNVGRSFSFCKYMFPLLKSYFPTEMQKVSVEQFYRSINKVQPSLIRTEADELTYHFHVIIRYELEKKLMENSITVKDIPAYWNGQYKKYLGVDVPDDKRGCLQDVHWSHGSFGYFPTYSLGSLYAAQFFNTASSQLKELQNEIVAGNFAPLLQWLRTNIHQHGRKFTSEQLCERVTGEPLNIDHFMKYARGKYLGIYTP
ncbi:carboxypeptidase M32 [Pinibacter aurantiacus]|uniref:Metal-dependent carboxypeptidase n=1 Tax=Pinibacter aurantiacus TaxID=2851599 RepID=A0A9E2S9D1_9BACT|nr:carboxypeptidase M32 [Pinibacter aurantiacus]MBV4357024.1 carboxypeptidase M32 [Pinibacter aurantiacus]